MKIKFATWKEHKLRMSLCRLTVDQGTYRIPNHSSSPVYPRRGIIFHFGIFKSWRRWTLHFKKWIDSRKVPNSNLIPPQESVPGIELGPFLAIYFWHW